MNPDIIPQIFLPCKATSSWQVYAFLKNFILPFRSFRSRILNMFWFICYFLLILLDSQSLITCLISAKEEPVFFFLIFVRFCPPIYRILSLLGSQSYMGCCYLKAEPFLFFSPGSVSLGQSVLFGLLLSEGRTFHSFFFFFFFIWFCLSWGVGSFQTVCFYLITTNLSLNLNKIKFTCLDGTYPFLYRLTFTLTMKNRDEKAVFVLIKKLALLLR